MNWSLSTFELPLATPLETARGTIETRTGWLVTVTAAGTSGTGEATPLPGWTEPHETCRHTLERVVAELNEQETVAACQTTIDEIETPAARHGCHLALADLRARQAGEPLYRWLGAEQQVRTVPVNATVGDCSVDATVDEVRAAIDEGFDCVKLKVGAREPAADADRLEAVRARVDADLALRADANGAWDRATAEAALEWLAAAGVTYVEQPLGTEELTGHAALREHGVGIALDETLAAASPDEIIQAAAADAVICKPMVLGGLDRALEAARRAREHGIEPILTTTIGAAVGRAGAIHLGAVLQPAPAFGLATGSLLDADLVDDPVEPRAGALPVSQAPGHGVDP